MARRVAVACMLALTVAVSAQRADPVLQGHPRRRIPPHPRHSPPRRRPPKRRVRRRRHFSATLGCGLFRPPKCCASGKWSVSGYRRGTNYIQGYTNVGDFAGTFAVGIKDRRKSSVRSSFDTRIDRDVRPFFVNDPTQGGIVDRYPRRQPALDRR